jgi:hypothetical protein
VYVQRITVKKDRHSRSVAGRMRLVRDEGRWNDWYKLADEAALFTADFGIFPDA